MMRDDPEELCSYASELLPGDMLSGAAGEVWLLLSVSPATSYDPDDMVPYVGVRAIWLCSSGDRIRSFVYEKKSILMVYPCAGGRGGPRLQRPVVWPPFPRPQKHANATESTAKPRAKPPAPTARQKAAASRWDL
jgi:hypothetical protein